MVKQNGGSIEVHSEVGVGTTFRVLLPLIDAVPEPLEVPTIGAIPRGPERVFVVEDEETVRSLAARILRLQGYKVSAFPNGGEALVALESTSEPPSLLVTDVILPGMSGRVLAERARALLPSLRVLFTSGYAEDAIARHGVLEEGIEFIAKPYTLSNLAHKVRAILDD